MENAPDGEEGREGGSSPEEKAGRPQDGGDPTADCGETAPPTQEDQSEPQLDDWMPELHTAHSGADEYSPTARNTEHENVARVPFMPHLSNLNTSEDTEDLELLPEQEEQEELLILDPEHPLVKRYQAALTIQLRKQLERIDLELKEKRAMEKSEANHVRKIGEKIYRKQNPLARLQEKLEKRRQTKAEAEAKRQQSQDQLEATKTQYSSLSKQARKDKANESQLQAELDNLMLYLTFTQGISEDLYSNVKAMKNFKSKAGAEKNQAEEQKLKQDLYVERLTKHMETLMQQIASYEAQASAQAEETLAAKKALSEAEMEMESLAMARKQLLQQWSSSLMGMRRRDEALGAMQEALRTVEHQVIFLDREIEAYKKSTTEEQEKNETLTMQLNWSEMDATTSKKLISQKQAQQEALQTHYSTCLRTLKETERTLARLFKETSTYQDELNDLRRQLEKESAVRLELEDKIMTHMQQKLTHNKSAKYSQRLTSKMGAVKKEKSSQLWQLKHNVLEVGEESSKVNQHLDSLVLTQEALNEEITKYDKLLTSRQAKMSSVVTLIGQKQTTITNLSKKISGIVAKTGHEDLSPLQIKVEAIMAHIDELAANIKSDQQLWMKQQGILVGLTKEIEANSKDMLKLQTEYTGMQQKKIYLESQIEVVHREEMDLEKNVKTLRGDLLKLNTLLSKNGQLSQALEQENVLMETDFLHRLKEAERETTEIQMRHERTQEEKEKLLNCLVEAERQIMLWEKKIQLVKETRSAVDSEVSQGDIKMMKAEIHRMELRHNQLLKQQEQLQRESEAVVARRESLVLRKETLLRTSKKQTTKGKLNLLIQGLQRKIQDTHKHVERCEQAIRELQESQVNLSDRLVQKKRQLVELCAANSVLESDFINLQDTKHRNLSHLVALQSRTKRLQGVCEGSYKALSTSETIGAAVQSQMERAHAVGSIVHSVCEEFPQHQGALRKVSQALTACTQDLEQEMS